MQPLTLIDPVTLKPKYTAPYLLCKWIWWEDTSIRRQRCVAQKICVDAMYLLRTGLEYTLYCTWSQSCDIQYCTSSQSFCLCYNYLQTTTNEKTCSWRRPQKNSPPPISYSFFAAFLLLQGLFKIPQLTDFSGFYLLQECAQEQAEKLITEATSPNRKRKMVQIFDDLSDVLCQVADMVGIQFAPYH
jgi:hypothetical protein